MTDTPRLELVQYPSKAMFAVFDGERHVADIPYGVIARTVNGVHHTRAWMTDPRAHPGVSEAIATGLTEEI